MDVHFHPNCHRRQNGVLWASYFIKLAFLLMLLLPQKCSSDKSVTREYKRNLIFFFTTLLCFSRKIRFDIFIQKALLIGEFYALEIEILLLKPKTLMKFLSEELIKEKTNCMIQFIFEEALKLKKNS